MEAAEGTTITISEEQTTTTMRDLVMEFTDAYNSLWGALSSLTVAGRDGAAGGILASDSSIRDMKNMLNKLTSPQLAASGPHTTLAPIGVHTYKDGRSEEHTSELPQLSRS